MGEGEGDLHRETERGNAEDIPEQKQVKTQKMFVKLKAGPEKKGHGFF